jgi:type IV secretory pathway ATPase VirB11/archaellum biosynthesis ATPase
MENEENTRIRIITPNTDAHIPPPPKEQHVATNISVGYSKDGRLEPTQFRDALARFINPWDATRRTPRPLFERNHRVRPGFATSWVDMSLPPGIRTENEYRRNILHTYRIEDSGPHPRDGCTVELVKLPNATATYYKIIPDPYHLSEHETYLIEEARKALMDETPQQMSLSRMDQTRHYVEKRANEIIERISEKKGFLRVNEVFSRESRNERILLLSKILARYTTGLGLIEYLLLDDNIEDIYVDAPASKNPIHLTFSTRHMPPEVRTHIHDKCLTNIILGEGDADSLLSRFRYESGRPFSEANPVLESDLLEFRTRVTVIGSPLSPGGVAMALRRHGSDTWTLPKLIGLRSMNPLTAGLISFLIDGRSTMLVAGSRGAGKSSMLSAVMLEFPQSQRILTIEDTLELPVNKMQSLGYKIQPMLVSGSVGEGGSQMTADDALRVSLRLGESAIVMGEVRGQEARTLYEAMRAGTAGSSVLGTFHADSAQSVYERVTSDMGIEPVSFLATDLVIIAGLSRPMGQQKQLRRVVQIAEVSKSNIDLKSENIEVGFNDLLSYDPACDELIPTTIMWDSTRGQGTSELISSVAKNQNVNYNDAMRNIGVRAIIRKILNEGNEMTDKELTSAEWLVQTNNAFWGLSTTIVEETGGLNHTELLSRWISWFGGLVPEVNLDNIDLSYAGVGLENLSNE